MWIKHNDKLDKSSKAKNLCYKKFDPTEMKFPIINISIDGMINKKMQY
jgi:hypothetical protein